MNKSQKPLVNRIKQSSLITFKLETLFPEAPILEFDIKDYLFRSLILREKDFRAALKEHDWTQYAGKNLAIHCSADAIIPMWASMLVVTYAQPYASQIFHCSPDRFLEFYFQKAIGDMDFSTYEDQRVVIKGCADKPIPASAYTEITRRMRAVAKSIMFGEPCSTVPIFKRK